MTETTSIAARRFGGYTLVRTEPLDHLHATFYELVHEPTGARHIHIEADDPSHAMVVALPTVPKDSTGVAHILEHVVLAGSKRFPVQRPFFSMTNRSLNDFMNASTSHDATLYYFSTRNAKDFDNLVDIYLDAVFFPLLLETTFSQEGHRLEFEDGADSASPLRFKGVVFNEMKGSMASPPRVLYDALYRALCPDLTYAQNSGGDPARMPDLTWEELKKFHATHYHPSNAYFYTYGRMSLEEILRRIESSVLSRFERITPDVTIPDQPRFPAPVEHRATYPLGRDEDPSRRSQVVVAWLGPRADDTFDMLALTVLSEALLGTAASPLHRALIDSKIGAALSDYHGLIRSARETVFSAGLKDVAPQDAEKVERVILETLEHLATDGVDPALVDAAVHQIEIDTREISNTGAPHAVKVFIEILGPWLHGGDPYRALQLDEDLARLETERRRGRFFEDLIRRHLLANPHRARVVLDADQDVEERDEQAERERLRTIEAGLTDERKRAIVEHARVLAGLQEAEQDLSVLPTLELSDVDLDIEDVPHAIEGIGGARVGFFPQPTNGLVYVDLRADFSGIPDRLYDRLGLFAYALPRVGAGADDYVKMASRIETYTGGIESASVVRSTAQAGTPSARWVVVRGKALARNAEPFASILTDLLSAASFEPVRLADVIAQYRTRMETFVLQAGHHFAATLAASKLSEEGRVDERIGGLTLLRTLRDLSALEADDLSGVIADLEALRDLLFRSGGLHVCVTSEETLTPDLRRYVEAIVAALPGGPSGPPAATAFSPSGEPEARTTSVPVAYTARIVATVGYTHPDAAPLMVAGNLMRATYLHRVVREQGGAYGSMASQDRERGQFAFMSYRDPHIARTYAAFDGAVRRIVDEPISAEELKEAILTSSRSVDPLLSPDSRGRARFFDDLAGYTVDVKDEFNRRLLAVTADDVRRVARDHLQGKRGSMAVISSPEKAEETNREMGGIFKVSAL